MANTYVDFSGRDFTAILERLQSKLIQEVPELTDLNYSDAGQFLLRRLGSESDYLHFYLDEAFYENFVETAEQRQSLINLSRLVDWKMILPSSATSTIRLTRIDGVDGDISIPEYSIFERSDGVQYLAAYNDGNSYTLLSTESTIDIPLVQGIRYSYTIREDEFSENELTGLIRYSLGGDVASGSVTVFSGDDMFEWEEVESFYRSTSTDTHFTIDYASDPQNTTNDTCYLVLGPIGFPTGDSFYCRFTKTVGSSGNCGSGTINTVIGTLSESVTCTNIAASTGGSDIESIASFKARLPQAVRTQRRGVTTDDYEALVLSVPGVRFCQAIDRNDTSEMPHYYVKLYVVPHSGTTISESLENDIYDQLTTRGTLGSWRGRYIISEATPYTINLTLRIGVLSGHNSNTVSSNLSTKLSEYLVSDVFGIGDYLEFGDLNIYAGRQAGVSWVEFDSPTQDITIPSGYIITPGTISITVS